MAEGEEKPPPDPQFDGYKAGFLLVAGIVIVHALVVLMGFGACIWQGDEIIGVRECDPHNRLMSLLAAALAAALAFSKKN